MTQNISSELNNTVMLARDLSKSYSDAGNTVSVLNNLQLSISEGERVAIVGQSGAGKSTLLNLLGGLDTPDRGTVEIVGRDIFRLDEDGRAALRNENLGFVYQFHHLLAEFSALENIAMPLLIGKSSTKMALIKAESLLEKVGLSHRGKHKPAQLSGGERQRVAIARALVMKPACVLMDEPTGNLDVANGEAVLSLIDDLSRDFSISFIVVTHDLQLANRMDRVLVLEQGRLMENSHG